MDTSFFQHCFEKHSFEELNNIDISLLYAAVQACISRYSPSEGVFIDVGCNAGSFVKALQAVPIRQSVHCFEPHPVLQSVVRERYPHVRMNGICIGDTNAHVDFHIPMWSVGLSSLINRPVFQNLPGQSVATIQVECKTLDRYCEDAGISEVLFLKIDVEGGEFKVLQGARSLLQSKRIRCGIFEVGSTLTDGNTSENEIAAFLEGYGYTVDRNFDPSNWMFYS